MFPLLHTLQLKTKGLQYNNSIIIERAIEADTFWREVLREAQSQERRKNKQTNKKGH